MAAVGAATVFLGSAVASSGDASAGDPPGTTGVVSETVFTQTVDPTREDYYDQFDHAVNVDAVKQAAESAFGSRFAGVIIDRSAVPNVLRVFVVNATKADQATLTSSVANGNPQVVLSSATVTWDQLVQAKDVIADALFEDGISPVSVVPVLDKQAVVVWSREPISQVVQSQLAKMVTGVPVEYTVDPGFTFNATDCRTCYPPYKAGKQVDAPFQRHCTSGYTVKNDAGDRYWGTSAGHCEGEGGHLAIGDHDLGQVVQTTFFGHQAGDSDSLDVAIAPDNARPRILISQGFGDRLVSDRYANSALDFGIRLCFVGANSNADNCSTLWVIDASVDYNVGGHDFHLRHVWCISGLVALAGDSGGPVFHVKDNGDARAAGLVTGQSDFGVCFSSIGYVLEDLNKHLYTK